MSKIKIYDIDPKERYQLVGETLDIIAQLHSKKDTVDFVMGLLTPSELLMISRRIQIAKHLVDDFTYDSIRDELGVGYKTIANVEQWMRRGDQKRQNTLKRYIMGSQKKKTRKRKTAYYSENMLDKYAHHRVLKEVLREIFS